VILFIPSLLRCAMQCSYELAQHVLEDHVVGLLSLVCAAKLKLVLARTRAYNYLAAAENPRPPSIPASSFAAMVWIRL
jgi:hypothetical protein